MDQEWTPFAQTGLGVTEIAPEVIEIIAGIAALEVEGIQALSGGFVGDLKEKLGGQDFRKGIKVEVHNQEVTVDAAVIVTYGQSIPQVMNTLQHHVKGAIETMTSLSVGKINVYVTDVEFPR